VTIFRSPKHTPLSFTYSPPRYSQLASLFYLFNDREASPPSSPRTDRIPDSTGRRVRSKESAADAVPDLTNAQSGEEKITEARSDAAFFCYEKFRAEACRGGKIDRNSVEHVLR
jgi:hypothetical protein